MGATTRRVESTVPSILIAVQLMTLRAVRQDMSSHLGRRRMDVAGTAEHAANLFNSQKEAQRASIQHAEKMEA